MGGAVAGSSAGAVTGIIGGLIPLHVRVVAGLIMAVVLGGLCLVRPVGVLQRNKETERALLELDPVTWAGVNGALLGLGMTSRIGFWLWYAIPLGCFVIGSPLLGALIWGSYGGGRMTAAAGLAGVMRRRPELMAKTADRLLMRRAGARRVSNVLLSSLMVALFLRLGL